MKIAILSRNAKLYSTKRLVEAARKRGHQVRVLDPLRCYMRIDSKQLVIHYKGKAVADYDAVIPRIGASVTFYGTAVVRQFEMMGTLRHQRVRRHLARARQAALHAAARAARASACRSPASATTRTTSTDLLEPCVGGPPLVIKLLEGTQGIGRGAGRDSKPPPSSVIEAFRGLDANFLVQEFVKEAKGADIRCFVVGGKVVAAMKRQAKAGEFRSNLHRGGSAEGDQAQRRRGARRRDPRSRGHGPRRGRRRHAALAAAGRWCWRSTPRPASRASRARPAGRRRRHRRVHRAAPQAAQGEGARLRRG